jgi:hypothetical protein
MDDYMTYYQNVALVSQKEVRQIDLIVHGTVGSESGSAMARTVSLPMAIAAKMLLNGIIITQNDMHVPHAS